jgi:hypothetical protein
LEYGLSAELPQDVEWSGVKIPIIKLRGTAKETEAIQG